jgi:hypothetical protein
MKNTFLLSLCVASLYASACDSPDPTTGSPDVAVLDTIELSARPASLLVVNEPDGAARRRFERTLERMGGSVLATFAPRLVIAQVPPGADAALAKVGLVTRFDRAVGDADVPGVTAAESRFLAVYSNRWQDVVPAAQKIEAFQTEPPPGESAEAAPQIAPGEPGPVVDPEDTVAIPYASGTVVVSIVLPESNGAIDGSTEDWTEDRVREVYLKVQAALDRIGSADPNAKLHFILHYESRPAAGGLEGTVDSDYEFGRRAQWNDWTNESLATANVLSRLVGHAVDPNDVFTAAYEY